jgi:hypothetical protein
LLREIHEQAHQLAAYFLTGEWPIRDVFNQYFVNYPDGLSHALILLAGPMIHLLIGSYFIINSDSKQASILAISILPLSRILAYVSGGGDELNAFKLVSPKNAMILGALFVLLFNAFIIYKLISNRKSKKEWIQTTILLISFSIIERLGLSILNSINKMFPTQTFMGTPMLIWYWMILLIILIGINHLYVQKKVG